METNQISEHLQVIRTLMERSALYRRELAPIMISAGALGTAAAALGLALHLETMTAFVGLWVSTAVVAVAAAFLIARRQAFKDHEAFWSPPTRRVAQALLPPLVAGLCLGLTLAWIGLANPALVSFIWVLFYGCALHAAGFFMPRGMKLFGWVFIGLACASLMRLAMVPMKIEISAHWLMGFFFGALHLGFGVYLRLTARKIPSA